MVSINYLGVFLGNHREEKRKKHLQNYGSNTTWKAERSTIRCEEAAVNGKEKTAWTFFRLNLLASIWLIFTVFWCHLGRKQKYSVLLESILMQSVVQFLHLQLGLCSFFYLLLVHTCRHAFMTILEDKGSCRWMSNGRKGLAASLEKCAQIYKGFA